MSADAAAETLMEMVRTKSTTSAPRARKAHPSPKASAADSLSRTAMIDRPIPPVTRHDKSLAVLLRTIEKAFA